MDKVIRHATCPLCEATCGLTIETQGREIVSIRGDEEDVFSHGYICPKAYSLKELDADPDRLRQPLVRQGENWLEVSWEEAFKVVHAGLEKVIQAHGRDAVGVYLGNPNVHNLSGQMYVPVFLKALRIRNIFSASTVDQMPKQVVGALMFGGGLTIPIPDVDRTDYLLILGANPLVSNGSLMTAPDMRGRLRRLRQRGGKIVVIDPVRTRTADEADAHYFIKPGTDALLLFAMVHTILAEDLAKPGRLAEHANGLEQVRELAQNYSPDTVAPMCGIEADTIRQLARELANAPTAAVYGRMGTCTQEFGTLASWLIEVLNFLTGNLDREGGAMFPRPAAGAKNTAPNTGKNRAYEFGRWKSRVRGLPEIFGELPVACLPEEIETPGEGQIRALLTIAGNPVLSTPDSNRLQKALDSLEFMVSLDIYLNETSRHANVILPALSPLERSHYDMAFYQLSIRNIANYSPPVFPKPEGSLDEWEVLLKLAGLMSGQDVPVPMIDNFTTEQLVKREVETPGSSIHGRSVAEIMAELKPRKGPERLLDFMLRVGPYGDGFGAKPGGLTLAVLEAHPHGVDLGPLQPRIPEVLRTASGKIELAPTKIGADVERLSNQLNNRQAAMLLVGRRNLRSNNSWMHNLPVLVKGKNPCNLQINPADSSRLGLSEGEQVCISSSNGSLVAPVEITETIMPGVVSLPHGWGHNLADTRLRVAATVAGVNSNILAGTENLDPLSGNAILNGIPVTLSKIV